MHARYRNGNQMSRSLSCRGCRGCLPLSLVSEPCIARVSPILALTSLHMHKRTPTLQCRIQTTSHTYTTISKARARRTSDAVYGKRRFANDLHHAFIRSPTRRRPTTMMTSATSATTQRRSDGESGLQIGPTSAL